MRGPDEKGRGKEASAVTLTLGEKVLGKNDRIAEEIRSRFMAYGVGCVNFIGSPGSGKTALLESSLPHLPGSVRCAVIEGDVKTDRDMRRIAAMGVKAVQIETGGGCHLDAQLVSRTLSRLTLDELDLVIIENVGNLICPVAYDLGEDLRLIVVSLSEGEDKPLKYPSAFASARGVVITKVDLAPYVDADASRMADNAMSINPGLKVFETSASTGEGIEEFTDFISEAARLKMEMKGHG